MNCLDIAAVNALVI